MKHEYCINENSINKASTNSTIEKSSIEKAEEAKYGEGEKEAQVLVTRGGKTFMRKQKVGRKGSNVQSSHEYNVRDNNKKLVEEFAAEILKKKDPTMTKIITDEDRLDLFARFYVEIENKLSTEEMEETKSMIDSITRDWNYTIKKNIIEDEVKKQLEGVSPFVKRITVNSGDTTYIRLGVDEKRWSSEVSIDFKIDKDTKQFKLSGIGVSGYTREISSLNEMGELILAGDIARNYKNNTSAKENSAMRDVERVLNKFLSDPEFKSMLNPWSE